MTPRPYTIRSLIFQTLDDHNKKGKTEPIGFPEILRLVRKNFPTSKFNAQAWNTYKAQYAKIHKKAA